MKKEERAYIAPHDTVPNALLRDSLELSPGLVIKGFNEEK